MSFNPLYQKWCNTDTKDETFMSSLENMRNSNAALNAAFSDGIKFINKKIMARVGAGTNLINEYTMTNIINSYIKGIQKVNNIKLSETNGIMLFDDNSENAKLYINIIARVFTENNIKVLIVDRCEDYPKALINFSLKEHNLFGAIVLNRYASNKDILEIEFIKNGAHGLTNKEIFSINFAMNQTNYLSLSLPNKAISYESIDIAKSYLNFIKNKFKTNQISKDLSFTIDIQNEKNIDFYKQIFEVNKLNAKIIKHHLFKQNFNINNAKSMNNAIFQAKLNRSKFAFVIGKNSRSLNVAYREKGRYIYLTSSEIASLYLYYQKQINPEQRLKVYKNYRIGGLVQKMCEEYNYECVEYNDAQAPILDETKDFVIGDKQKYYLKNFGYSQYDPLLMMFEILKIFQYFEDNKTNFSKILNKNEEKFHFYHDSYRSEYINHDMAHRFFERLKNVESIGKQKIIRYEDIQSGSIDTNNKIVRLKLSNNINIILTYSIISKTLSVDFNIASVKNQNLQEMLLIEKDVLEKMNDYKEDIEFKKPNLITYLKYLFYFSLIVLVVLILFMSVWNIDNSGSSFQNPIELFKLLGDMIFKSSNAFARLAFFSIIITFFINTFVNALMIVRIVNYQGHKIKLHHTIVAAMLGIVITNITPKAIGGEIAFYWYLRRKGYDKSALITSVVASGLIWQISNAIMTLVFVPIGIIWFSDILSSGDANINTFIIFMILGFISDTAIAVGVFIISASHKLQKILIKWIIFLFQWFLFTNIYDPRSKTAKYTYEFLQVRNGFLVVFKKWWQIVELLIYRFSPWILSGIGFFLMTVTAVNPNNGKVENIMSDNLQGGKYWSVIASSALARIANAISILPGGTGSSEYFSKQISGGLFAFKQNDYAILQTVANTTCTVLIPTIISTFMFINVWWGEKRIDKQIIQNKNNSLLKGEINNKPIKSRFYTVSVILWTIILASAVVAFFTIGV